MNQGSTNACPECGTKISPSQRFCKECGATLPAQAPAAPSHGAPYAGRIGTTVTSIPYGEIIVAICSLVVMIISLQFWYEVVDYNYGDAYAYARAWPQWLVFAFSLILLIFSLIMIANRYLNFLPEFMSWPIYSFGGALILIFAVLPTFIKPTQCTWEGEVLPVPEWDILRMRWAFLVVAIIFAIGIIVGGILKAKEEAAF